MNMRRFFLVLMLVFGMVSLVAAQDDDERYFSPDGLFSVPIPTNWTVEQADGYAVLVDPDEMILVYVLAVAGDDLTAAVDDNIRALIPDFDMALADADIQPLPPDAGVDEAVIITYEFEMGDETIYQGLAQSVDGVIYLMLFDAEFDTALRRQSQINIIASGFTINALDQVDLSDVAPLTIDEDIIAELEEFIRYALEAGEVPGASVSIVQDGEVIYSAGFGVQELGGDEPVTPDTMMMIGSTSKTMTTVYLSQLADEGIITWDTPVIDILPSFALADPEVTDEITFRNLMCACTGVPRRDLELIFNADELTPSAILADIATYRLFTGFGEAFQYSNQLIAAGGYIGALAEGGDLADAYDVYTAAIESRILAPLGMENSFFAFERAETAENVATPHGVNLDMVYYPITLDIERFVTPVAPAGALWSTANDMSQYLLMLLAGGVAPNGERIVSEENLLAMWEPQVGVTAQMNYGLGWFVDEYKGLPLLHHGGNTFGFTSDLAFLPTADIGISVLTNARGTNIFNEGVRTRLFELVFDLESDILPAFERLLEQAEEAMADIDLSAELDLGFFADFVGSYANAELGGLDVQIVGDAVILDAGEFTTELRASLNEDGEVSDYLFHEAPLTGLPVEFEIDGGGQPQIVIDIGTDRYVFTSVD
ncbi:MAG: class A beta-lactamase-related serine hydrolase [Anaerolineaceae bacterium]|nr:MAG: class A beta-lactamase-related serine hydrolase [Anaerolineaceae bacterium]